MGNLDDVISDEEWDEYFEMMKKVSINSHSQNSVSHQKCSKTSYKDMEENFSNFKTFSDGLLEGSFIFAADYYSYVERGMNSPADSRYNVSVYEEETTEVEIKVTLTDGVVNVEMPNLQLKNSHFPKFLSSKLKPHQGGIHGNRGDDFRIGVIPLPDVATGRNSNVRMELLFRKDTLCGINFVFSDMDDNFHVYETILNLDGSLKEYI